MQLLGGGGRVGLLCIYWGVWILCINWETGRGGVGIQCNYPGRGRGEVGERLIYFIVLKLTFVGLFYNLRRLNVFQTTHSRANMDWLSKSKINCANSKLAKLENNCVEVDEVGPQVKGLRNQSLKTWISKKPENLKTQISKNLNIYKSE